MNWDELFADLKNKATAVLADSERALAEIKKKAETLDAEFARRRKALLGE